LAYSLQDFGSLVGGISQRSVYNLIEAGDLKTVKIAGRRLVLKEDLDAFLARARTEAA
jgi:excisionase family DNA binding protein